MCMSSLIAGFPMILGHGSGNAAGISSFLRGKYVDDILLREILLGAPVRLCVHVISERKINLPVLCVEADSSGLQIDGQGCLLNTDGSIVISFLCRNSSTYCLTTTLQDYLTYNMFSSRKRLNAYLSPLMFHHVIEGLPYT